MTRGHGDLAAGASYGGCLGPGEREKERKTAGGALQTPGAPGLASGENQLRSAAWYHAHTDALRTATIANYTQVSDLTPLSPKTTVSNQNSNFRFGRFSDMAING